MQCPQVAAGDDFNVKKKMGCMAICSEFNCFNRVPHIPLEDKNLKIKTLFEAYKIIYLMISFCDVCQTNVNQAII